MTPQYQFNLGSQDPLLYNSQSNQQNYVDSIDQEMQRLNAYKQSIMQVQKGNESVSKPIEDQWSNIDKEIDSLTNDQKQVLYKDETYNAIEQELSAMIQQELINSVKDRVANSARGKELLEKEFNYIKVKKEEIIKESNREIELFKKFQISVQANPNLTYAEFIKNIK